MTETTTKPGSADAGDSTQGHAAAPKPDTKPDTCPPPIPLSAPGGTVMAWACGHCRRVAGGMDRVVDVYDDEAVGDMADHSRTQAERCCSCRECGGVWVDRYARVERAKHQPYGVCGACWTNGREADAEVRASVVAAQHRAEDARCEESLAMADDQGAAIALRDAMSDLSERCYCAGWLIGCEVTLWKAWERAPFKWGMGTVETADAEELRGLHERAGGWWSAAEQYPPLFVPTDAWTASQGGSDE